MAMLNARTFAPQVTPKSTKREIVFYLKRRINWFERPLDARVFQARQIQAQHRAIADELLMLLQDLTGSDDTTITEEEILFMEGNHGKRNRK